MFTKHWKFFGSLRIIGPSKLAILRTLPLLYRVQTLPLEGPRSLGFQILSNPRVDSFTTWMCSQNHWKRFNRILRSWTVWWCFGRHRLFSQRKLVKYLSTSLSRWTIPMEIWSRWQDFVCNDIWFSCSNLNFETFCILGNSQLYFTGLKSRSFDP